MNITERLHQALPEIEPFDAFKIQQAAIDTYWAGGFRNRVTSEFPRLPKNFGHFFVTVYPEKVIEGDTRIPEILTSVAEKLGEKSHEPVVVVNEHEADGHLTRVGYRHISFGFSLGPDAETHVHAPDSSTSIPWGAIRPVLFAPQTIEHHDDIGISFTNSFGIRSFEASPLSHIGAYLLDRQMRWVGSNNEADQYMCKVKDDYGQLLIGNAEIQEYIEEHPDHAAVIDGCRDTFRNKGNNPEVGRAIAKAFNLEDTLSDAEQTKLTWF